MRRCLSVLVLAALALSVPGKVFGQCIPFSTPTPGVISDAGDLADLRPGAVFVLGLVVDGTAEIAGIPGTYHSDVDIAFPPGLSYGLVAGFGRLTTPVGVLEYRITGSAAGNPFTREFSWELNFLITGGTGLFEGASGKAVFVGTSDATTLEGITEGTLCLAS